MISTCTGRVQSTLGAGWMPIVVVLMLSWQLPCYHAFAWNNHLVDTIGTTGGHKSALVSTPDLILPTTTATWTRRSATKNQITTTTLWRQPNKWDFLDDLDDDDDGSTTTDTTGRRHYTSCPPDMMYEPKIVQRAHQTFLAIRQAGGKEMTNDVYVRDPIDKEVFWYTGKVARVSDVTLEDCIHRLYPMMERHACHLRPLELYPHRGGGTLEVWTAPGDSELEVAYNRPSIQLQQFVHSKEWQYNNNNNNNNKKQPTKYPSHIKASMVGFQGEVYQEGEDGFRTWRNDDGLPARPELNPGGETRPPTPEELAQLQKELSTTISSTSSTTTSSRTSDQVGYIDAEFTSNQEKTSQTEST